MKWLQVNEEDDCWRTMGTNKTYTVYRRADGYYEAYTLPKYGYANGSPNGPAVMGQYATRQQAQAACEAANRQ